MTLLRDADPSGVLVSLGYLLGIAASIREALRAGSARDRLIWSVTAATLVALLVNQQGDLHSWALSEGSDLLESYGIEVQSPPVIAASAAVLILVGIAALWLTVMVIRSGWPPGAMATCGLLLIVAHGTIRGAGFLHIPQAGWAAWGPQTPLRTVEAVGVALVTVGILRWGRARQSADSPAGRVTT